ncbi:MAG: ribonuclease III [Arcanobacterium sp.]|nr:ribonuclease III [Arcanobacterium sp.]
MNHDVDYSELIQAWGIELPQADLEHALTHKSWAYEHEVESNERLEFLGDSILGFITVEEIFTEFPDDNEGVMSKYKAASVSEYALTQVAHELELGKYLRLGKGEANSGGQEKPSLLSDAVEAMIAVTYLTHGIEKTREIVLRHIEPRIREAVKRGPGLDWRTSFEELARDRGMTGTLTYKIEATGPDHARAYLVKAFFADQEVGQGTGSSQKVAKLMACKDAYERLNG